jgi:hypothetical protein
LAGNWARKTGGCGVDCGRASRFDVGLDGREGGLDWPATKATDITAAQPATSSLVITDSFGRSKLNR